MTTTVLVHEYVEAEDSFTIEVITAEATVTKSIPASEFFDQFERLDGTMRGENEQMTEEEVCIGMIYEMHYHEEPSDLVNTFYRHHEEDRS